MVGGSRYQEDYAVLQLTNLLAEAEGLVAVRYEGLEDVDLKYKDNSEQFVQLKNEPRATYSISSLRSILQGFALDLLEVGQQSQVSFRLVAKSNSLDTVVRRLADGSATEADIDKIAKELVYSTERDIAPHQLTQLSPEELRTVTGRLVENLNLDVGRGDREDGISLFEFAARSKLRDARIKNADHQAQAVAALRQILRPGQSYTSGDVAQAIRTFVQKSALESYGHLAEICRPLEVSPAIPSRIKEFYEGHPPGWDIIAANGDVPRDDTESVLKGLRQTIRGGVRMLCVVGEPGSGKSTFLYRLGWDVVCHCDIPVIRIRSNTDPSIWGHIEEIAEDFGEPFVILADDLFSSAARSSLEGVDEVNKSIEVTIVTTAWPGMLQQVQLKTPTEQIDLKGITARERNLALVRLGKSLNDLNDSQRVHFESATCFLPLMLSLSTGNGLRVHCSKTLGWVKEQDSIVYRACEYVSYSFQYGVAIPSALLSRLDENGWFYRVERRDAARPILFESDACLRLTHVLIAREMAGIYGRDPRSILNEICHAIDPHVEPFRRFLAHLLRASRMDVLSETAIQRISQCLDHAKLNELGIWGAYFRVTENERSIEDLRSRALSRSPETVDDWGSWPDSCQLT